MNRLLIGLGTSACIACLGFTNPAVAANGSIAASMAKDFWIASKKNQERAAAQAALAATRVAASDTPIAPVAPVAPGMAAVPLAPLTRPPADNPRPAR